jgi:hypothetical protein
MQRRFTCDCVSHETEANVLLFFFLLSETEGAWPYWNLLKVKTESYKGRGGA